MAEVRIGALTRYGAVTRNGEAEAVEGLVLGLRGANAGKVVVCTTLMASESRAIFFNFAACEVPPIAFVSRGRKALPCDPGIGHGGTNDGEGA